LVGFSGSSRRLERLRTADIRFSKRTRVSCPGLNSGSSREGGGVIGLKDPVIPRNWVRSAPASSALTAFNPSSDRHLQHFQFGFDRRLFARLALPRDPPCHCHQIVKEHEGRVERNYPDTVYDTKSISAGPRFRNPGVLILMLVKVRSASETTGGDTM